MDDFYLNEPDMSIGDIQPIPSHDPLAAIVRFSEDAIISKDLDGTVRSWNTAAEKILGYNSAQVLGNSIFTMVPTERFEEERNLLRLLSKGTQINHFETQRLTRDGKIIDVSLRLSPIFDTKGRTIVGASSIVEGYYRAQGCGKGTITYPGKVEYGNWSNGSGNLGIPHK